MTPMDAAPRRISVSLLAHTNVGKTTLARTLLGADVGEVRDAAHVTEFAEGHELVVADGHEVTVLTTFPNFPQGRIQAGVRQRAWEREVRDGIEVLRTPVLAMGGHTPLPKAMLRQMVQARFLGLLDDEVEDQDKPRPDAATAEPPAADTPPPDEDADLQLQPHDAAGRAGTEPGAGGGRTDG